MKAPPWLTTWWGKTLGALGLYATLAGLGLTPLPAAAIALVIGSIAGQVQLALAVALGLSLVVNLVLVGVLTRHLRRRPRHVRAGPPRPKAYAIEGNLDSIILTSADLEAWWANMLAVARERVGPDARAYVESIHIDSPFISFRGESLAAMRSFSGTVSGPDANHVSWYGINRKETVWDFEPQPPLWRTDDSWRELLKRAWLREKPTRSSCVLYEAGSRSNRHWKLIFGPYQTDDERLIRDREYRLVDGQLVVSGRTA